MFCICLLKFILNTAQSTNGNKNLCSPRFISFFGSSLWTFFSLKLICVLSWDIRKKTPPHLRSYVHMYLDSVMYKFLFPFVFKGLHCCNLMDKGLRDIIIFVYCKYDNDKKSLNYHQSSVSDTLTILPSSRMT